jgi:hypothetical protein
MRASLRDPRTGDTFDHEGKKIARKSELPQRGHMKTPHELACAISALINAKPRSPTIAELETVIVEHTPPLRFGGFPVQVHSPAKVSLTNKELDLEALKVLNGAPPAYSAKWFKPKGDA